MWEQVGRLHAHHAEVPVEIRLLKLTEEVGEAAEALIGMRGLNSRKGTCRSRDDLLAELSDVIITAAVAMSGIARGCGSGPRASRTAPGRGHRAGRALTHAGPACGHAPVVCVGPSGGSGATCYDGALIGDPAIVRAGAALITTVAVR